MYIFSTKLLLAAKALAADPNAPNAKNQLAAAARLVTDSINTLINVCTSSAPGQKECDTALRNIQMVASVLDDPKVIHGTLKLYYSMNIYTKRTKVFQHT